jgi:hypothetical protein
LLWSTGGESMIKMIILQGIEAGAVLSGCVRPDPPKR